MALSVVVLAAGKGTRMKSELPKCLHEVAGAPMVAHHRMGRGNVVLFNEVVTIRGFQRGASRLLLNAMLYGPSL